MIMFGKDFSADRMAEEFLNYLFENYQDSRHVRRVASWLGLLVLAIESIKDEWWIPRERQLFFTVDGHRYKAKYGHNLGTRGGIEIIEVAVTQGQREIGTAMQITSLDDAARFYTHPRLRPYRRAA